MGFGGQKQKNSKHGLTTTLLKDMDLQRTLLHSLALKIGGQICKEYCLVMKLLKLNHLMTITTNFDTIAKMSGKKHYM